MSLNAALLERTMTHIEAHPEQWDQAHWGREQCGTVACFAGWAVLLDDPSRRPPRARQIGETGAWVTDESWMVDGVLIDEYALELLGLTEEQADVLFSAQRTLRELRAGVNALIRSDGVVDDEVLQSVAVAGHVDWRPAP